MYNAMTIFTLILDNIDGLLNISRLTSIDRIQNYALNVNKTSQFYVRTVLYRNIVYIAIDIS